MALMRRTGITELDDRDVSEASGGQLQPVGICPALISRPAILLGDKPTGALDSAAASEIMDILGELNAEGTTIMLATHDAKVAARTDRLLYWSRAGLSVTVTRAATPAPTLTGGTPR